MYIQNYETYQETKTHFDADFPYNTYPCCIPQDFPSVPLHWHLQMEIIYVKKGRGTVSIDLTAENVQAGDIILIAPGQLHGIFQFENDRMEYENILFDLTMLMAKNKDLCTADFFEPLQLTYVPAKNIYTSADPAYRRIACHLDRADEICRTFPPAYQLAIKGCLFSLFYELFSDWQGSAAQPKSRRPLEKLKQILKYVEQNYQKRITIEEISSYSDYSPSHFMKYFKNAMGMSFIEYVNDYRLMTAARMLLSCDDTILAIAGEIGFDNLSHFNRCFKKKFGKTPSAYRTFHETAISNTSQAPR